MTSKWRALTPAEIKQMSAQCCTCGDWSKVQVADGFNPERVKTTHFSGDVRMGVFQKDVKFDSGLTRPAGLSNATIHNCYIGNNVYINEVKSSIANYQIEDDVIIENIDLMVVEGRSSFGNGTEAADTGVVRAQAA